MRLVVHVEMDTEKSNQMVKDGSIGPTIEGILAKLMPEAAYFFARGGRRALTLIVDAPDGAALPSIAEPFWLQLGASVDATETGYRSSNALTIKTFTGVETVRCRNGTARQ